MKAMFGLLHRGGKKKAEVSPRGTTSPPQRPVAPKPNPTLAQSTATHSATPSSRTSSIASQHQLSPRPATQSASIPNTPPPHSSFPHLRHPTPLATSTQSPPLASSSSRSSANPSLLLPPHAPPSPRTSAPPWSAAASRAHPAALTPPKTLSLALPSKPPNLAPVPRKMMIKVPPDALLLAHMSRAHPSNSTTKGPPGRVVAPTPPLPPPGWPALVPVNSRRRNSSSSSSSSSSRSSGCGSPSRAHPTTATPRRHHPAVPSPVHAAAAAIPTRSLSPCPPPPGRLRAAAAGGGGLGPVDRGAAHATDGLVKTGTEGKTSPSHTLIGGGSIIMGEVGHELARAPAPMGGLVGANRSRAGAVKTPPPPPGGSNSPPHTGAAEEEEEEEEHTANAVAAARRAERMDRESRADGAPSATMTRGGGGSGVRDELEARGGRRGDGGANGITHAGPVDTGALARSPHPPDEPRRRGTTSPVSQSAAPDNPSLPPLPSSPTPPRRRRDDDDDDGGAASTREQSGGVVVVPGQTALSDALPRASRADTPTSSRPPLRWTTRHGAPLRVDDSDSDSDGDSDGDDEATSKLSETNVRTTHHHTPCCVRHNGEESVVRTGGVAKMDHSTDKGTGHSVRPVTTSWLHGESPTPTRRGGGAAVVQADEEAESFYASRDGRGVLLGDEDAQAGRTRRVVGPHRCTQRMEEGSHPRDGASDGNRQDVFVHTGYRAHPVAPSLDESPAAEGAAVAAAAASSPSFSSSSTARRPSSHTTAAPLPPPPPSSDECGGGEEGGVGDDEAISEPHQPKLPLPHRAGTESTSPTPKSQTLLPISHGTQPAAAHSPPPSPLRGAPRRLASSADRRDKRVAGDAGDACGTGRRYDPPPLLLLSSSSPRRRRLLWSSWPFREGGDGDRRGGTAAAGLDAWDRRDGAHDRTAPHAGAATRLTGSHRTRCATARSSRRSGSNQRCGRTTRRRRARLCEEEEGEGECDAARGTKSSRSSSSRRSRHSEREREGPLYATRHSLSGHMGYGPNSRRPLRRGAGEADSSSVVMWRQPSCGSVRWDCTFGPPSPLRRPLGYIAAGVVRRARRRRRAHPLSASSSSGEGGGETKSAAVSCAPRPQSRVWRRDGGGSSRSCSRSTRSRSVMGHAEMGMRSGRMGPRWNATQRWQKRDDDEEEDEEEKEKAEQREGHTQWDGCGGSSTRERDRPPLSPPRRGSLVGAGRVSSQTCRTSCLTAPSPSSPRAVGAPAAPPGGGRAGGGGGRCGWTAAAYGALSPHPYWLLPSTRVAEADGDGVGGGGGGGGASGTGHPAERAGRTFFDTLYAEQVEQQRGGVRIGRLANGVGQDCVRHCANGVMHEDAGANGYQESHRMEQHRQTNRKDTTHTPHTDHPSLAEQKEKQQQQQQQQEEEDGCSHAMFSFTTAEMTFMPSSMTAAYAARGHRATPMRSGGRAAVAQRWLPPPTHSPPRDTVATAVKPIRATPAKSPAYTEDERTTDVVNRTRPRTGGGRAASPGLVASPREVGPRCRGGNPTASGAPGESKSGRHGDGVTDTPQSPPRQHSLLPVSCCPSHREEEVEKGMTRRRPDQKPQQPKPQQPPQPEPQQPEQKPQPKPQQPEQKPRQPKPQEPEQPQQPEPQQPEQKQQSKPQQPEQPQQPKPQLPDQEPRQKQQRSEQQQCHDSNASKFVQASLHGSTQRLVPREKERIDVTARGRDARLLSPRRDESGGAGLPMSAAWLHDALQCAQPRSPPSYRGDSSRRAILAGATPVSAITAQTGREEGLEQSGSAARGAPLPPMAQGRATPVKSASYTGTITTPIRTRASALAAAALAKMAVESRESTRNSTPVQCATARGSSSHSAVAPHSAHSSRLGCSNRVEHAKDTTAARRSSAPQVRRSTRPRPPTPDRRGRQGMTSSPRSARAASSALSWMSETDEILPVVDLRVDFRPRCSSARSVHRARSFSVSSVTPSAITAAAARSTSQPTRREGQYTQAHTPNKRHKQAAPPPQLLPSAWALAPARERDGLGLPGQATARRVIRACRSSATARRDRRDDRARPSSSTSSYSASSRSSSSRACASSSVSTSVALDANHVLVEEMHVDEQQRRYVVLKSVPCGKAAARQRALVQRLATPRRCRVRIQPGMTG